MSLVSELFICPYQWIKSNYVVTSNLILILIDSLWWFVICKQEEIIHKNYDGDAHDDGDAAHDILLGQGGDHSFRWMEDNEENQLHLSEKKDIK